MRVATVKVLDTVMPLSFVAVEVMVATVLVTVLSSVNVDVRVPVLVGLVIVRMEVVVDVMVIMVSCPCTVLTGVLVITTLVVDLLASTEVTVDVFMAPICDVDANCAEQIRRVTVPVCVLADIVAASAVAKSRMRAIVNIFGCK